MRTFADAVAAADPPGQPGTYALLDGEATLLYVGKAADLRRRLRDHVRAAAGIGHPRLAALYACACEVRWEKAPDDAAAAVREADLIVALRPPFNASHRNEGRWAFIVVAPGQRAGTLVLRLAAAPGTGRGVTSYGCFPHLGRGVASAAGQMCSDGYAALLRLLWAAGGAPGGHVPARLARSAPDRMTLPVDEGLRRPLHSLLSGTSDRLLGELARRAETPGAVPAPLVPGLRRDHNTAAGFFQAGPAALRRLRLAAARRAGPLCREEIERLVLADLITSIGPVRLATAPDELHLGRRARPWTQHGGPS